MTGGRERRDEGVSPTATQDCHYPFRDMDARNVARFRVQPANLWEEPRRQQRFRLRRSPRASTTAAARPSSYRTDDFHGDATLQALTAARAVKLFRSATFSIAGCRASCISTFLRTRRARSFLGF